MMKLLENKWALITGSSRGIGQQIALGLAERKCNIIVHARKAENAERTLALLKPSCVKTHLVTGVLDSHEGVESIVRAVNELPDKVDILYNNAAIMSKWQPMWQIPQEEWLRVFQTNLFAMIQLCTAFAPGMKERGFGRIINVTSGIKDTPELTPYSVSKAAVDKYSRDLAFELRGSNVLVNYLDPGWLKTDLGGPNADHEVETVLPGALVPALLDDLGPTGQFYAAQDYSMLGK
ncbi:MAG: NAD(P)-dependent oxidoreductase [Chloroflexi bacterium HGW-Chloroflexi-4]|nr:MAG: NAD(P)-dependent oxidoreductase [Chloroflexi bacterium HGW-Chloroflexi-4]